MLLLVLLSLVLFSEHNCDQSSYIGTVLKIGEDSVVGQIDFETGQDDWTLKNMKIVDIANSLENVENIPGEGHVAVPQVSMSGDQWGKVYKTFDIPAFTRVAIEFSVFVSGFDPEVENSFFSSNPDLLVRLVALNTTSEKKLTNLARLKPQNKLWNKYRTEVQTGSGLRSYRISLELLSGSGVIALDGVRVEIVPVVENEAVRGNFTEIDVKNSTEASNNITEIEVDPSNTSENSTDVEENEGFPINTTGVPKNSSVDIDNSLDLTNSSTNQTNNSTEESSNNVSGNSTNLASNSTDTANNSSDEIVPSDGDTAINSNDTSNNTVDGANLDDPAKVTKNLSTVLSANNSLSASNLSSDTSMYGYSGEIVLIILTVLFITLFLGMVYKYHRLKSHMGDYQLNQGGSRPGQENQGYDVQMSYRMDD